MRVVAVAVVAGAAALLDGVLARVVAVAAALLAGKVAAAASSALLAGCWSPVSGASQAASTVGAGSGAGSPAGSLADLGLALGLADDLAAVLVTVAGGVAIDFGWLSPRSVARNSLKASSASGFGELPCSL